MSEQGVGAHSPGLPVEPLLAILDRYKDEDILGLSSKFRCAKKVSKELGYEWEYSGIVEDSTN